LRYLGFGAGRTLLVRTDEQGRIIPAELDEALSAVGGPAIVCLAAGNVNTGAFDPFGATIAAAKRHDAWVHVDGAFGLWAAAARGTRHLTDGMAGADSWSVDAHKWLNVPYDCGLAIVAEPSAHNGAMNARAAYLPPVKDIPDPGQLVPELSRRARGFPVYAALRALGRSGVADLVERCCAHARRFATGFGTIPGCEVVNDVVLNQVLVRFGDDERTRTVVQRVLADGTAFMTGTTFKGRAAMRVSVSNWSTTEADIDRCAQVIVDAARSVTAARPAR
jgi:glutamate/tyrosine decarboxylase-like PLP-dependent enzyme